MISESIAVGSVNGNSLGKKQGGRKRRNEVAVLLRGLQAGIIKSPVSSLNVYTAN